MKIISINVNGIRASAKKGLFEWLDEQQADFVCLQEVRAQEEQRSLDIFYPQGYHHYYVDAQRKGYSGVAIFAKQQPKKIISELGWEVSDQEGRYVQCDYDDLSIISLYLPSGSSGDARQAVKYDFLARFAAHLNELKSMGRELIICGDFNIVHKEIDIKNWRSNQKSSGCLPEERAWLDELFGPMGFVDAFRLINQAPHQYTWWSNRGRAWDNNVGWRIDYQATTSQIAKTAKVVDIYKAQRFSDHAPLIIEYDMTFS